MLDNDHILIIVIQMNIPYKRKQRPLKTWLSLEKDNKPGQLLCKSVKLRNNYEESYKIVKKIVQQQRQKLKFKDLGDNKYSSLSKTKTVNMTNIQMNSTMIFEATPFNKSEMNKTQKLGFLGYLSNKIKVVDVSPEIVIKKCHLASKFEQPLKRLHYFPFQKPFKRIKKKADFFKQIMSKVKEQSFGFTANQAYLATQLDKQIAPQVILNRQNFQKGVKFRITNKNLGNYNNLCSNQSRNQPINKVNKINSSHNLPSGRLNGWEVANNNASDIIQY